MDQVRVEQAQDRKQALVQEQALVQQEQALVQEQERPLRQQGSSPQSEATAQATIGYVINPPPPTHTQTHKKGGGEERGPSLYLNRLRGDALRYDA